jgi:shikimate kinase
MHDSIILTGPMGSGKTSVGQLLAARLGYVCKDLDALIVATAGKSINQLFAEEGEDTFRERESAALSSLVGQQRLVISTGGGVVIRESNRRLLHAAGLVVNLTATTEELARRLARAKNRPLLKGDLSLKELILRILIEREPFYADADIRIDTTSKTLEDVVTIILRFYVERRSGVV